MMESSKYATYSMFLLFIASLIHPAYCSGLRAELYKRQPVERTSNTSFYGGVALSATTTTQAYQCTAGSNLCSSTSTCCPQGTFCQGIDDGFCCPLDVDCTKIVHAAPVCADSSWGLYEIDITGPTNLRCCAPGAFALADGGGCLPDSATTQVGITYTAATSLVQAHGLATTTATTTGAGSGITTGSSSATSTAEASPTPSKASANKLFSGGSAAAIAFAFLFRMVI